MITTFKEANSERTLISFSLSRLFSTVVSVLALVCSLAVGYATYKERFTTISAKVEQQQSINEQLKEEITRLRVDVAKLQGALDRNTEALNSTLTKYVNSR